MQIGGVFLFQAVRIGWNMLLCGIWMTYGHGYDAPVFPP